MSAQTSEVTEPVLDATRKVHNRLLAARRSKVSDIEAELIVAVMAEHQVLDSTQQDLTRHTKRLRTNIDALSTRQSSCGSHNKDLQKQIEECGTEIQALSAIKNEAGFQAKLEKDLKGLLDEAVEEALKVDAKNWREPNKLHSTVCKDLREQVQQLLTENTRLAAKLLEQVPDANANDELESLKARHAKQVDALTEELGVARSELENSKATIKELKEKLKESEVDKAVLEDKMDTLIAELQQYVDELASVKSQLQKALDNQDRVENGLAQEVEGLQAKISEQSAALADCEAEIKGLSDELRNQGFAMKALLLTNDKQERDIVELRDRLGTEA